MPRPRDAVDEAVGASTRRVRELWQFRDGVRATQAAVRLRSPHHVVEERHRREGSPARAHLHQEKYRAVRDDLRAV